MHYVSQLRFGELHIVNDEKTGLRAIVAIHNLKMGPSIGGCRCLPYSTTEDALRDVMRLARGMTYKAAISGIPHGGGKSVIMRPNSLPHGSDQRQQLFERFGDFLESLGGKYLVAEDSGTMPADMNVIRSRTEYVLGSDEETGTSGDPSPSTAFGVRRGIEACVKFRYDRDDLEGLRVAVQGVGNVGYHLCKELASLGASLIVTDVDDRRLQRVKAEMDVEVVAPRDIYAAKADIFAPCALGSVINDTTIPQLRCDIVAGAANNQLQEDRHGKLLRQRDIVYAPDYAINAGGLINVASEYEGYDPDKSRAAQERIYDTTLSILERARREDVSPHVVADRMVEEIIYG